jgi:alpha-L-fucosidase
VGPAAAREAPGGGSSSSSGSSSGASGGDSGTEPDATTTPDSSVEPGDSGAVADSGALDTSTGTPVVYDAGPCPAGNPICTATTWAQVNAAHSVPSWVKSTKLGIGMHFMVATVPADHNEWFYQHEYCNSSFSTWTSTYFPKVSPLSGGPWGYKDFIPLFTCAQWSKTAATGAATSAASWAALFKASGATYVNATAMHHDRFAMWDSAEPAATGGAGTWNAMKMGPKRDVVGELGAAVKALGMKYGVNNHMLYGYSFAYCGPNGTTPGNVGPKTPASVSDLYDPRYASLYGPPNAGCGALAADATCSPDQAFCDDWLYRAKELVDKYAIDDEWFDWDGATIMGSPCMTDKLAFVLHYYQTAAARGQQVQIMSKAGVFPNMNDGATGANTALQDFQSSIPSTGPSSPWMVDETISSNGSWCYVDSNGGAPNSTPMAYKSSATVIDELDEINGKGGIMMLNVSPMLDGTIPQGQIDILNAVGKHLGAQ